MRLLIASTNKRKIDWMKTVFKSLPEDLEIVTLEDIGYKFRIEECGDTCEVNSVIKAIEPVLMYPDVISVSDDGGLFIEDIDIGGVHSHRHKGDFSKDILRSLEGLMLVATRCTRKCEFRGSATVAWHNGGKIFFKTFEKKSNASLRIRHIKPDDIPDNTDVFKIIERAYDDHTVPFINMDMMMQMNATGALDLYTYVAWFIRQEILKIF